MLRSKPLVPLFAAILLPTLLATAHAQEPQVRARFFSRGGETLLGVELSTTPLLEWIRREGPGVLRSAVPDLFRDREIAGVVRWRRFEASVVGVECSTDPEHRLVLRIRAEIHADRERREVRLHRNGWRIRSETLWRPAGRARVATLDLELRASARLQPPADLELLGELRRVSFEMHELTPGLRGSHDVHRPLRPLRRALPHGETLRAMTGDFEGPQEIRATQVAGGRLHLELTLPPLPALSPDEAATEWPQDEPEPDPENGDRND